MLGLDKLNIRKDFIKKIIFLTKCSSTNTLARDLIIKNQIKDNTLIISRYQTAGRGQGENKWEGEPFKNIHLSIILKSPSIKSKNTFFINMITSLACYYGLKKYISIHKSLKIKWPNDIFWDNHKLGGILIENIIKVDKINFSIVGIGINVNQKKFNYNFNKDNTITSISLIEQKDFLLYPLIQDIINEFAYYYISSNSFSALKKIYNSILYKFDGKEHYFEDNEGLFKGSISDIDNFGRLKIRCNNIVKTYINKQVQFI